MRNPLSNATVDIPPSGIRKFFDIVSEMKNIILPGVGELDFDILWHICKEGIYSLEKGRTFHTPNAGLKESEVEICNYLKRRCDVTYDVDKEVMVTVGGSEAIDIALWAMLNPGEEVLIPQPSHVSYVPCTRLAGGAPVIIELEKKDQLRLTLEKLLEKLMDKTKILILPFPNNLTGAITERKDLEAVAKIATEKDIFIITDEIYSELTHNQEPHVTTVSPPDMRGRTVLINGFSKAYAMTGWRSGYTAAPHMILEQMLKIHQSAIMRAPTTSQYTAVSVLCNEDGDVQVMREFYDQRRRFALHAFEEMKLECFGPHGTFYAFPSIKRFGMTSDEFVARFLEEEKVVVVPGTVFGDYGEGYLRVSYACSLKSLKEVLGRMERFVKRLDGEAQKTNVVLFEPEMPANTGNIGRTCVAMGMKLRLIEPLGFKINEKAVKWTGLDYWGKLDVMAYSDYQEFLERNPGAKIYMVTTKVQRVHMGVEYEPDCFLMFGKESAGILEEILVENQETYARIPMWGDIRPLNLPNSVSIVPYEALRQNGFEEMTMKGDLHRLHWK